jgi:hypothetical protein
MRKQGVQDGHGNPVPPTRSCDERVRPAGVSLYGNDVCVCLADELESSPCCVAQRALRRAHSFDKAL